MSYIKGIKSLNGLIKVLGNVDKYVGGVARNVMSKHIFDAYRQIQRISPVGSSDRKNYTGGSYRAAWQIETKTGSGVIFEARLTNNLPYAYPLDYGSPVGKKPWPSAGPKTVENKGKVYSKQAPKGVSTTVFTDSFLDLVTRDVTKSIMGVFR